MARYTIVGQRSDTEVVGGSKTRPVQVVEVTSGKWQIYFEARLPRNLATTANLKAIALSYAVTYDALGDLPGVNGQVVWTEEPNNAGQLEDHVIVYVTSDSGDSEGQLNFRLEDVTSPYVDNEVAKLRAALNATEGAG